MTKIEFITPQFNRSPTYPAPPSCPSGQTMETFRTMAPGLLREHGLAPWDEPDEHGDVLWLFPAEWYDDIPEGFLITDIDGNDEVFESGVTDNDRRMGYLAFGMLIKE